MTGHARIVFMGSPEFAVPSLRALHAAGYEIAAVVTQPDRPAGRGGRVQQPAVKRAAIELGLQVEQPNSMRRETVHDMLRGYAPDLFVVAAYGKILPREVLDIPAHGAINVHASLLPRWRGASPITAAILAGDETTGVTIMEMAEAMDAGPIIAQAEYPIGPDARTGPLEAQLADLGAQTLVDTLPQWLDGSLRSYPQDDEAATYCRPLAKSDGHLRADMTAIEAERAVRAYDPWPGAYLIYRDYQLKVWDCTVLDETAHPAGTMFVEDRQPAVAFSRGAIVLNQVQKPGKQRIDGRSFLNGERGDLPPSVGLA